MKSIIKIITVFLFSAFVAGCFSFSFGLPSDGDYDNENSETETVLIANTNNVYRFATNTVLKVKVQQGKNGKWVEIKERVVIPENWFIVCGDGLE